MLFRERVAGRAATAEFDFVTNCFCLIGALAIIHSHGGARPRDVQSVKEIFSQLVILRIREPNITGGIKHHAICIAACGDTHQFTVIETGQTT
jgi:hypothetical protein